ncbi:MAG: NADH-quinone oxidoreductase subunit I [Spirochaetota bacterium]
MLGIGILKGMGVSLKRFWSPKITEKYPEVQPDLPSRSKGSFAFNQDTCISCELCSMACPNGVIKVEWHKDEAGKKQLDRYRMNLGHCLFCGLCVEACPTKPVTSIAFLTDFELGCWMKQDIYRTWKKTYPPSVGVPAATGPAGTAITVATATTVATVSTATEGGDGAATAVAGE